MGSRSRNSAAAANVESEAAAPQDALPQALFGSDILPSTIELTPGTSVQLGDVVRHAFEASGLTVDEFNAQESSHREEQLQASIAAMREEAEREASQSADQAQSTEEACAEHGLSIEEDGHCPVEILLGACGAVDLVPGQHHRLEAAEAVRAVRAGIAKPRS